MRKLVEDGARWRWPDGIPEKARAQLEHELELIGDLHYESYFLTVHDIVRFARERGILCQGRGSAANSSVCFVLGITELDPVRSKLLFERFLSRERNEPPDIDVDFEHDRREEVIQYVFQRYGRNRAALTAVASSYRATGALRMSPRRWACRRTRSTPWPAAVDAGVSTYPTTRDCARPASTRTIRFCAGSWC